MSISETNSTNAYETILNAAEDVVRETGAIHLTLDAVCARAGISKGGLLYHFRTKESLIRALVKRMPEIVFDRSTQLAATLRESPARVLKALILTTRDILASGKFQGLSSSLLAAAYDPNLFEPTRETRIVRVNEMSASTGLSKSFISAIFFALEGLWIFESLKIAARDDNERSQVIAELIRLVEAEEQRLISSAQKKA